MAKTHIHRSPLKHGGSNVTLCGLEEGWAEYLVTNNPADVDPAQMCKRCKISHTEATAGRGKATP